MLNRLGIRKALLEYKEAKQQYNASMKDKEVLALFDTDEQKAYSLMVDKYPLGSWDTVTNRAYELISIMSKDIPDWKGIDVKEVWLNSSVFNKLVTLAEKV